MKQRLKGCHRFPKRGMFKGGEGVLMGKGTVGGGKGEGGCKGEELMGKGCRGEVDFLEGKEAKGGKGVYSSTF